MKKAIVDSNFLSALVVTSEDRDTEYFWSPKLLVTKAAMGRWLINSFVLTENEIKPEHF